MAKKVFTLYLAKEDVPNSEAYAKLDLPASPWEWQDALDKVRLREGETLYWEIEDYYGFEYLVPHLTDLSISLNELNDLAARLVKLDEVQRIAYRGMVELKARERKENASGVLTAQDLRDCAASAAGDGYHIVDASDHAALGRFYAENGFVPEVEDLPDKAFELLDFAKIGKTMREGERGCFVGGCYVLWDGEPETAPPCPKELPAKPDYLFRFTLALYPDHDRTAVLTLPATEEELNAAQEQLGTLHWANTVILDYDGVIPNIAYFANLPTELEAFNEFAQAVRDIPVPHRQLPKLKALLEQFEVTRMEDAMALTEHLEDYILTPELSSPRETAIDQLHFMMDDASAELLEKHLNLYAYGQEIIARDNAVLSPYGLLHRADRQPMLQIIQEEQTMGMKMK